MEKRWKAEQEVFKEQIAREDTRLDKQDKRDEEMLGFMRIIAESVQKMANWFNYKDGELIQLFKYIHGHLGSLILILILIRDIMHMS